MSALENLISKLDGARQSGASWSAKCPAHPDRAPSLSITPRSQGDPGVVVHCHAGCEPAAITAALQMTVADLFDDKPTPTTRRRIVATYDYRNADGNVAYQVVRYDPKEFRQRRPDGNGGWIYKLDGIERVPYRLPELIAANPVDTVFIVEGEKDVEALVNAGYVATCGPQGAGSWSKVSRIAVDVLQGRDVFVVADADTKGRAHAREVAASLQGIASDITVVEAAIGKDAADHLSAGRTIGDFVITASTIETDNKPLHDWLNNHPDPTPADDTLNVPLLERVDILPSWRGERTRPPAQVFQRSDGLHLFPAGIGYIFGDSGDGKSWLILLSAWQLMRQHLNVIWVSYEDPNEDDIVDRLRYLGATEDELEFLHLFTPAEPLTMLVDELAIYSRRHDARLFVLDSVGEANAVEGVNEDSDAEWGQWARATIRTIHDLAIAPDWESADGTPPCTSFTEIPIDHSTKSKDNPHFPSGTKRKRAMVTGLMVSVNVRQALAKDCVGRMQIICSKDRTGRFRRGEVVAEVIIDATVRPYAITIDAPPDGQEMSTSKKRNATDRVLEVLNNTDESLTVSEIRRIANSDTNKSPGEADLAERTVGNTLTKLTGVNRTKDATGVGAGYVIRYSSGGIGT